MANTGTLSADGNTSWIVIPQHGWVHVACVNDFGGGTITIQQQINDTAYSVLDGNDAAIAKTAAFDEVLYFGSGDIIRLNLSGATSPTIYWKISGPVKTNY